MHILFITEDRQQLEQSLSLDDRFTDLFARHPLSAQEVRLIVNGRKYNTCCTCVATPVEAAALPELAVANLRMNEAGETAIPTSLDLGGLIS
ncbi:hypothetical protein C1752_10446 [Acaryochloris thomasi RCC1774]|uniref:Uncharacterized protein n=1 Tax=Acaryochloris thomasi RCC1774 TaxID=1764569 RepID=A0A2W1J902_9CYAN|nr:hypothetical protein [Acaryochloris thomasi]PZD70596.1 hypothetical protein C1752_10446 [Acaryochloris thomasi RCC1774]